MNGNFNEKITGNGSNGNGSNDPLLIKSINPDSGLKSVSLGFTPDGQNSLLITLEKLLAINSLDIKEVLTQASDLVAVALRADKVDIFLYKPEQEALVAMGVSHTPIGRKQKELGLNVLYLRNNGRTVSVFHDQKSFVTGHAEDDPDQLVGVVKELGIHSTLVIPLFVKNELRGIVEADAVANDAFSEYDLHFLEAVTDWVSIVLHRTELIQDKLKEVTEEIRRATAEELITYSSPKNNLISLFAKK